MDPLVSQILNGASLSVILKPNPLAQVDFPEMVEVFALKHLVISGDKFLGKTSNTHGIHHQFQDYSTKFGASYAYSNYCNLVFNSSHTEEYCRFYHASRYDSIEFKTLNDYELIWNSEHDENASSVEKAVTAGMNFKIGLLDNEDTWNIHPVHMPSFYVGKDFFEFFTEQDAMPLFFRSPENVMRLEELLKLNFKEEIKATSGKVNKIWQLMPFFNEPEFYSTYHTVRSDGTFLRGRTVLVQEKPETYRALRIYASKSF